MRQGKLIVLEGIDGSGKSTQYRLLTERLRREGCDFHSIVFPRYKEASSALIREYLGGAYGSRPEDVNACAASAFYTVDRYASYKQDWGSVYEAGGLILADRYTTSNAVHQGCKVPEAELPAFLDWLYDFEYGRMGLPEPDLVVYLDVDLETALRRIRVRAEETHIQADIHEQDDSYLRKCLHTAKLAAEHYHWRCIDCFRDGKERDALEKHEEIYEAVREAGVF